MCAFTAYAASSGVAAPQGCGSLFFGYSVVILRCQWSAPNMETFV